MSSPYGTLSALSALLVKTVTAVTADLEMMVAKVLLAVRFLGDIQKMPKQIFKVHLSLTFLTKRRSSVLLALSQSLRITTRRIMPRTSPLLANTTNFAGQMLVLHVMRSAIHFLIVQNRSPGCLRVL
jgi:hypothetical protein